MTSRLGTDWTVDALRALPGGGTDYEVVGGRRHRLAFPTASHENAIALLHHLLSEYATRHALGRVERAPLEMVVDSRTVLRPDLVVLSSTDPRPALVIEVLSPQTAAHDRGPKRVCYQELGVLEVWLVDFDSTTVERWRPDADGAESVRTHLVWQPVPDVPPLRLFLPAVFGEAQFND